MLLPSSCSQFLILLIITCIPFSVTSQSPLESEIQVLLKLKQQWHTSPFVKSWHPSIPSCGWPGIRCTNDSVTSISLPNQNITTKIPSAICELNNLVFLNLSYNFIPGCFPIYLYNCSKLQTLDLWTNNFHGLLPSDINKLSNLRRLDVGNNSFEGNIPDSITHLTKLTCLSLEWNSFNGTIPPKIGILVNLETLSLDRNPFLPGMIPKEFGRLKNLNYLWMWDCNLIGNIPSNFANLSSLKALDLSNNNLVGKMPSGLFQLKYLTGLYLFNNQLSGEIPTIIEALNLVEVKLYRNNLAGEIPYDLGKLQQLEILYLYNNQLSGPIPSSFTNLSSLKDLQMFLNNFTGEIPKDLGKLQNLEFLSMYGNQLSGPIPDSFANLSSLNEFDLSGNNLKGTIPNGLGKLHNLEGLYLLDNQLNGPIPELLANCNRLQHLRLDYNMFTGEYPLKLWTLPNMLRLTLQHNKLSGKLPSQLSRKLYFLDIRNNYFSGPIPSSISSWKNLKTFLASNNQLHGSLPLELTALSNLNILQLDGNLFSGNLPSRIISWKSLSTLNLSGSNISGPIPTALCSLPMLTFLDLSNNKLSGQIPPVLGTLILYKLNLSSNDLSGKLPSTFNDDAYNNSFLKNPKLCSESQLLNIRRCSSSKHKYMVVTLATGGSIFILLLCATFLMKASGCRKEKQSSEKLKWELKAFHKLDFTESEILFGLTENNVIGSGGSGKVYRMDINESGEKVAVKRIWGSKILGHTLEKQFLAEAEILGRIRHANVVKLFCCISSEDSKLLVYEYLENESLYQWLHKEHETHEPLMSIHSTLDWPTRLRIAIGAAKGLSYMYHGCSPAIIHRDVKSSNILLDSEFNAKIADFGLAKISTNKTGDPYTVSAVAGSFGYIAPEYSRTRRLNEKIDIYSFGVVLLELSTGKEPRKGNDHLNLAQWSWQYYHEGNSIEDVLDNKIKELCYIEEMMNVFKLGIMCTSVIPSARPTMKQVLELLITFSHDEASDIGTQSIYEEEHDGVAPFLSDNNILV